MEALEDKISILNLEIETLQVENENLQKNLASKTQELKSANCEIEKFSENFVQNILDANLSMPVMTNPVTSFSDSDNDEELENRELPIKMISEKVWTLLMDGKGRGKLKY